MEKISLKQRFYLFMAGTVFPALIYIFGLTWRVRYVGKKHEEAIGKPLIWAFWHSRQLPLVYFYRRQDITVLVSRSFDGEIISRAIHRFGFRTVRGSSSTGAASSLREIVRELRRNARIAFTPDGPRGPRETAQIVAAAASALSKTPIIALATASNRKWVLSSWDRFQIPKLFAKVEIRLTEPIYPEGKTVEEINSELQTALDRVTREADESFSK